MFAPGTRSLHSYTSCMFWALLYSRKKFVVSLCSNKNIEGSRYIRYSCTLKNAYIRLIICYSRPYKHNVFRVFSFQSLAFHCFALFKGLKDALVGSHRWWASLPKHQVLWQPPQKGPSWWFGMRGIHNGHDRKRTFSFEEPYLRKLSIYLGLHKYWERIVFDIYLTLPAWCTAPILSINRVRSSQWTETKKYMFNAIEDGT